MKLSSSNIKMEIESEKTNADAVELRKIKRTVMKARVKNRLMKYKAIRYPIKATIKVKTAITRLISIPKRVSDIESKLLNL